MAKVLIIEDDALLSRMYQTIFSSNNYEVETAIHGADGLAKAKASHPDLILLDMMMPKVGGLEVIKLLKAEPTTAHIPVVVLTNLSGSADTEAALALGALRYIVKSEYKPKQVEEVVHQILADQSK